PFPTNWARIERLACVSSPFLPTVNPLAKRKGFVKSTGPGVVSYRPEQAQEESQLLCYPLIRPRRGNHAELVSSFSEPSSRPTSPPPLLPPVRGGLGRPLPACRARNRSHQQRRAQRADRQDAVRAGDRDRRCRQSAQLLGHQQQRDGDRGVGASRR